MLFANIPLYKIENLKFKAFLQEYTRKEIPKEATLRKGYVDDCYQDTLAKIRNYESNNKIWVSIDETTDVEGRFVANVIIGVLRTDGPGEIFLLNTEELEKANHQTIFKRFDKSMNILWPQGVYHDNVLLFFSDAAPYMVKSGKVIQALYSKMIHVTCIVHGFHRVAEEVRSYFNIVDQLISNVKKVFLKAPTRSHIFKNEVPDIPMPPQLILTRWETWLDAANYYCENYEVIKNIIKKLDENDASSIKKAKDIFNNPNLKATLAFISSNYSFLSTYITRLEKQNMMLSESISIVKIVKEKLQNPQGEKGKAIYKKLENVLSKNKGFEIIEQISNILEGIDNSMENLEDLNVSDLKFYKFAPVTSVDVERSFSRYKNVLANNRRSFTFENIRKILVIQCNSFGSETEIGKWLRNIFGLSFLNVVEVGESYTDDFMSTIPENHAVLEIWLTIIFLTKDFFCLIFGLQIRFLVKELQMHASRSTRS
ncbi:hypothetical protein QTP88_022015 [Uroleucon formosanum]